MSPQFSEAVLRGLDRYTLVGRIAARETEVNVQREVVDRLERLLDDERRDLDSRERGLSQHRDALAQLDALPEVTR